MLEAHHRVSGRNTDKEISEEGRKKCIITTPPKVSLCSLIENSLHQCYKIIKMFIRVLVNLLVVVEYHYTLMYTANNNQDLANNKHHLACS